MYFPIFRGKQNELLALRDCKIKLSNTDVIIPIIEPVKNSDAPLMRCLFELNASGANNILTCNPSCGDFKNNRRRIFEIVDKVTALHPCTSFAYWVHEGTSLDEIKEFIKKIDNKTFYLIHKTQYAAPTELLTLSSLKNFGAHLFTSGSTSRSYRHIFNGFKKVIIQDNFRKLDRNADYSGIPNELFTDQHLTYTEDGLIGFGDFSTVGDNYSDTGGQAHTVAIHLTYENKSDSAAWIRHFISSTYTVDPDVQFMINEALVDAIEFLEEHKNTFKTFSSYLEIKQIHETGRSTNLGYLKKISIKHHLELMMHLLEKNKLS